MKLLILTQKVDKEDPILGFFHNWILKFSGKFESIIVICLEKGVYDLPSNVSVYSLGKEKEKNKIKYILNFYKYIWQKRNNYDAVLVHMNQEYVLLGGVFWKIFGKKIFMWRNHPVGSFFTIISVWISDKVFCTSNSAFTAKFSKTSIMPAGIDIDIFKPNNLPKIENSILFLGRIAPIKNLHLFIKVLKILKDRKVVFRASIYGDSLPEHDNYFNEMKEEIKNLDLQEKIIFYKSLSNNQTPDIYRQHKIFVNLTPSGSMDKTILEAAACGSIPIVINEAFKNQSEFLNLVAKKDPEDIANKIIYWLSQDISVVEEKQTSLYRFIKENHGLDKFLAEIIVFIR